MAQILSCLPCCDRGLSPSLVDRYVFETPDGGIFSVMIHKSLAFWRPNLAGSMAVGWGKKRLLGLAAFNVNNSMAVSPELYSLKKFVLLISVLDRCCY